jgi:molecular chaperone DnaJ
VVSTAQGGFALSEPCRDCRGKGSIIDDPCPVCRGSGRRERLQRIRVPAGVADGQKVRVRGRGGAGERGGPPGDLEVLVHVAPSPLFGREGANLTLVLPVTFPEAALGAEIKVPTPDGPPVTVRIPAGTSSGRRLRVRGRGMPTTGGQRGDLLVTVDVAVPKRLSDTAKAALEEYAKRSDDNPRAHLAGF